MAKRTEELDEKLDDFKMAANVKTRPPRSYIDFLLCSRYVFEKNTATIPCDARYTLETVLYMRWAHDCNNYHLPLAYVGLYGVHIFICIGNEIKHGALLVSDFGFLLKLR